MPDSAWRPRIAHQLSCQVSLRRDCTFCSHARYRCTCSARLDAATVTRGLGQGVGQSLLLPVCVGDMHAADSPSQGSLMLFTRRCQRTLGKVLGHNHLDVHVGWCPRTEFALKSRYVGRAHRISLYSSHDGQWLDELLCLIKRERFDLVVPGPRHLPAQSPGFAMDLETDSRQRLDAVPLLLREPRSGCRAHAGARHLSSRHR